MKYFVRLGDEERVIEWQRHAGRLTARCGDVVHEVDLALVGDGGAFSLVVDGTSYDVVAEAQREQVVLQMVGERFVLHCEDERERAAHAVAGHKAGGKRELHAAMPGIVIDVRVKVGDAVEEGQTLVVLEAMKMQNPLTAEAAGKVTRVVCKVGEAVAGGAVLLELE
ncbi:MAG: acetyl-CoA carboxylase biotin carboxyl carrier protein subunit [Planctomycetes bacterium]|nr:acetyl-CoA carboxylase biotin carboxyl carrier protein subunit [Planctomycetota bacterium]